MDDLKEKEIEEVIDQKITVPKNIFHKKQPEAEKEEISKTELIVKELHDQGLIEFVEENVEVQSRIMKQVDRSINMELSKIDSRGKKESQEAAYDANKEACKYYGVSDSVEEWKINMMKGGSAFWFVVWFIISSISFTPIAIVADKINNFIKWYWLSLTLTIIIFVFVVIGLPLLFKYNII